MSLLDVLKQVTVGSANEDMPMNVDDDEDHRDSTDLLDEMTALEWESAA